MYTIYALFTVIVSTRPSSTKILYFIKSLVKARDNERRLSGKLGCDSVGFSWYPLLKINRTSTYHKNWLSLSTSLYWRSRTTITVSKFGSPLLFPVFCSRVYTLCSSLLFPTLHQKPFRVKPLERSDRTTKVPLRTVYSHRDCKTVWDLLVPGLFLYCDEFIVPRCYVTIEQSM